MNDTLGTARATVALEDTNRLISSDRVEGTAVYNLNGDHLGQVHHLMIDKLSGQIAYAVLSFGGLFGIGESYHPLPWSMLKYEPRRAGYVVDLDRNRLAGAAALPADQSSRLVGSGLCGAHRSLLAAAGHCAVAGLPGRQPHRSISR